MSDNTQAKPTLLAGFYDPVKRSDQVMQKLEKELEHFRKIDFTKDVDYDPYSAEAGIRNDNSLEFIKQEIYELRVEVGEYPFTGGHFTKQYRTFQGACDKLLQRLDSLTATQQDANVNIKEQRSAAIQEIQVIVAHINSKVHPDGKCCPQCELYGTMWQ